MSSSFQEQLKKAKWEYSNNPRQIRVMIHGIDMSVESIILISPDEFASSFFDNHELRKLAIEQGTFKPFSEEEQ
jgi:hypothetical protein